MKTIEELKSKALDLVSVSTNNIYLSNSFLKTYTTEITELQKKVIFYAISSLKNNHRNLTAKELSSTQFTLKIQTFLKLMNYKNTGQYHQILCDEIEKLMKNPIKYEDIDGKKTIIGWFDKIVYIPKHSYNKSGVKTIRDHEIELDRRFEDQNGDLIDSKYSYISFKFTESMSEILLNLTQNGYTKYNFMISHSLKSKHSIRIYELLQTRKDTNTIYMSLEDFNSALLLKSTYKDAAQMKRRVLDVAKKELNEKFNLGFDYSIDYKTRKITLSAKKNDNDLCKEIFDTEQYRAYKEEPFFGLKVSDKPKSSKKKVEADDVDIISERRYNNFV